MFRRQRQVRHTNGTQPSDDQHSRDASAWRRYQMRQQVFTLGNDYFIEDEQGQKSYRIDGIVMRLRDTLVFRDMLGKELCKIQERRLRVKNTMEIEDTSGARLAVVRKALITPFRQRWEVEVGGTRELDIQGDIFAHEYTLGEGREKMAEVSKKWFHVRDTYGVAIAPGQNDVLVLAITVAIDMMAHQGR